MLWCLTSRSWQVTWSSEGAGGLLVPSESIMCRLGYFEWLKLQADLLQLLPYLRYSRYPYVCTLLY